MTRVRVGRLHASLHNACATGHWQCVAVVRMPVTVFAASERNKHGREFPNSDHFPTPLRRDQGLGSDCPD